MSVCVKTRKRLTGKGWTGGQSVERQRVYYIHLVFAAQELAKNLADKPLLAKLRSCRASYPPRSRRFSMLTSRIIQESLALRSSHRQ